MSPEEREQVADIERFQGRAIERVTLRDFDYGGHPEPPRATAGRASRTARESRRTPSRSAPSKARGTPHPAPSKPHPSAPKHGARHQPAESATPIHGRRRRINPADRRSRKRF
jgi:hypothetical protein